MNMVTALLCGAGMAWWGDVRESAKVFPVKAVCCSVKARKVNRVKA